MQPGTVVDDGRDKRKLEEDTEDFVPYALLDKTTVLQEARIFNDANHVRLHPKRCCQQITKLLYLLAHSERFTSEEASGVFFGVTKLFQSKDGNLRRLVYLFLKEVVESTDAAEIIIVVQSLCKDMNSDVDLYRANSIRVLAKILDASMLGQIERYMRQALVDKNDLVASSALVSGLQLMQVSPDVVRRWVNEVQTALNSTSGMVQFHSLALLHSIKRNDPLAVSRLVAQMMKSNNANKPALVTCMLIRYSLGLFKKDSAALEARTLYNFLESCLHHQSEMVIYEAARAICDLPDADQRDLAPAVTVLHMFLSSVRGVVRFAAVKTLSRIAQRYPMLVAKCNDDLENLLGDSNRTIATLAITTLLQTGSEANIDRFIRQISKFMADIGDEFKIVVVNAIHDLALRIPKKFPAVFTFLSGVLRDEGGFDLKKAVVDVIIDVINKNDTARGDGLLNLCEYIEDCEYTALATRILHVLGDKCPHEANPAAFIRYIYNRVILENSVIRAAAVSALAKFAARVPSLSSSIIVLLNRCQNDDDDEVRDRATLYLTLLKAQQSESDTSTNIAAATKSITAGTLPMSVQALQKSLQLYSARPAPGPLTFDALPRVEDANTEEHGFTTEAEAADNERKEAKRAADAAQRAAQESAIGVSANLKEAVPSTTNDAVETLYKIPEFSNLGSLFRSVKPVALTESEVEYVVYLTKHVFENHVVFDFRVVNTVEDLALRNVRVHMEPEDEIESEWSAPIVIAAREVRHGSPAHTYVCFERNENAGYPSTTWHANLHFQSCDVDHDSGEIIDDGFDEEFDLEDVSVTLSDYITPRAVSGFRTAWENASKDTEVREGFKLPINDVSKAVQAITQTLGLAPCEGTGEVKPGSTRHNCYLAGIFVGNYQVLARMQVQLDESSTCVLRIAVRSADEDLSQLIVASIQ